MNGADLSLSLSLSLYLSWLSVSVSLSLSLTLSFSLFAVSLPYSLTHALFVSCPYPNPHRSVGCGKVNAAGSAVQGIPKVRQNEKKARQRRRDRADTDREYQPMPLRQAHPIKTKTETESQTQPHRDERSAPFTALSFCFKQHPQQRVRLQRVPHHTIAQTRRKGWRR